MQVKKFTYLQRFWTPQNNENKVPLLKTAENLFTTFDKNCTVLYFQGQIIWILIGNPRLLVEHWSFSILHFHIEVTINMYITMHVDYIKN